MSAAERLREQIRIELDASDIENFHVRKLALAAAMRAVEPFLVDYKAQVQREDAATVRAQAPKYLDTAEDIAAFLVLDKAAALIEPDKEAGQ